MGRIAERVSEVLRIKPDEVFSKGRQNWKVNARSLYRELIAKKASIHLKNKLLNLK